MPTFIGLDLAWSADKESGICWLEGDSRESLRCTRLEAAVWDMNELATEVAAANPAVVTIDAPVLYTDKRWVDAEIGRKHRFHRYKIAAHSAKAAVHQGNTAGIDLGKALTAEGFDCNPQPLLRGEHPQQSAVEVYPHTLHVRLFNLCERILYKKGLVAQKRAGLQQYQRHLEALIEDVAPEVLAFPDVKRALDPETARNARGRSLKRLDDTLDGLTCALGAWLIWQEPECWEMIGDLNGYIVAPREGYPG